MAEKSISSSFIITDAISTNTGKCTSPPALKMRHSYSCPQEAKATKLERVWFHATMHERGRSKRNLYSHFSMFTLMHAMCETILYSFNTQLTHHVYILCAETIIHPPVVHCPGSENKNFSVFQYKPTQNLAKPRRIFVEAVDKSSIRRGHCLTPWFSPTKDA